MYEKIVEQSESMFKPFAEIININLGVMEAIREKQADLMGSLWSDSLEHVKTLSTQTRLDEILAAQKDYWELVQAKVSSNAEESFSLLSESHEKMSEKIQGSVSWPEMPAWGDLATPSPAKAPTKKNSSKKASPPKSTAAAPVEAKINQEKRVKTVEKEKQTDKA